MNRLLNEKSRLFANADPYAVSDYVNQHVGSHCIRLPKSGRPAASLSHRSFGSLDLCRISYGGSVRVTSPALETIYHLQVLLQGHCRRQAVDGIHIGHAHLVDQAPCIRRHRLEVAPLRFGEHGAEGQRRLARTRDPGEHHQCIARNGDIDILEVVLARTAHLDAAAGGGSA